MAVSYQDITNAREQSNQANQALVTADAGSKTIEQELTEALRGKIAGNQTLIGERNQAQADYLSAPSVSRAKYSDPNSQDYVFNPYQRDSLVAQDQSRAYKQYADLTDYLGMAMGSIPEIVNSASNAYQSGMMPLQYNAQNARQNYEDVINEYKLMQSSPSGSGGTSSAALLSGLLGGQDLSDPATFYALGVSSGMSPSEIATSYKMLYPGDVVGTRQKKEKSVAYDNAKRRVQDALNLVNSGKNVSGFAPFAGLRKVFGGSNKNRTELERILADLAGGQAFAEAGKALTDTERQLIQGKIPEIKFNEKYLKDQLESIMYEIDAQRAAVNSQTGLGSPDDLWQEYGGY
jgi:hypothetical protein